MKSAKTPNKSSGTVLRGEGGELHQQPADAEGSTLTTNFGVPISDNQNSLRAGARGPGLIEDFVLREKIHHFDHERIPERIVHARGSGAHGVFELRQSLAKFTRARILTQVGKKTEVFVRFSTVAGGAGSVDTPRDVRGFAVKFYTAEGNWDLVGNNIPVFFIQDAIKFPDLIHSVKMEADRGYPQAASAHDTFWDFIGLMPESTHMVMWAMSDRTLPRSLRMMEGFGVHAFRLVNEKGASTFVKFHWRPVLGTQATCWDETIKIAGADPDFHRRDLYEAIANGNYPAWDLCVQLITEAQADKLPFDILDATKLVPEEIVPLVVVGRMTLNRNPDNFFAETEQVAFLPTNVPPGIDFSDDPLLHGRTFSYQDTQLSRLGSHNHNQLPINAPKGCPYNNFLRDGHMQMQVPRGRANYEPNSLNDADEVAGPRASAEAGFRTYESRIEGEKVRARPESFADHFSQARMFFRSLDGSEQDHLIAALVFELSKVSLDHVRSRVLSNLRNVDEDLVSRVASGLGLETVPPKSRSTPVIDMDPSPALRLIGKYPPTLKGRCVAILTCNGADASMLKSVRGALEKAGASVKIIAPKISGVTLDDGKSLKADGQLAGSPSVLFDAIALVLSSAGTTELLNDSSAVSFVADAFAHLKAIGFTALSNPLLETANVAVDNSIVAFGRETKIFIEKAASREWSREPKVRPRF